MKKYLKNDQGYTLLVALGLVMMLMIFMFSFTRIAVSQKVQIEQTDSTLVTTALAEMGAEYYEEKIISEVNEMIQKTKVEMEKINTTHTNYETINNEMGSLATTVNSDLMDYYQANYYLEEPTTPAGVRDSNTTYVSSGRGYRLVERTLYDTASDTVILKVVGFTENEESQPISIELKLPELLMWKGDKTEEFSEILTFEQYATLTKDQQSTVTFNTAADVPTGTYTFTAGNFYHFVQGATFNQQQFGDAGGLNGINVLSGAPLNFEKHFHVTNSNLISTTITLDFNSNSQTEIGNSHIIANKITITKGDVEMENVDPKNDAQKVDFYNGSTICLLPSPEITSTQYNTNITNLKKVLLFDSTSYIVYKKDNGSYYTFKNGVEELIPEPKENQFVYNEACNIMMTKKDSKNIFEAFDPNNMELSDVIYE